MGVTKLPRKLGIIMSGGRYFFAVRKAPRTANACACAVRDINKLAMTALSKSVGIGTPIMLGRLTCFSFSRAANASTIGSMCKGTRTMNFIPA